MWDVIWYPEDKDPSPVQAFLSSLNERLKAGFLLSIEEVSDLSIVEQDVAKYLEKQLWEIGEDRGFCRLIFSYLPGQRILLLHGFCHHSSPNYPTPSHEISVALERLESFTRRAYNAFPENVSS